MNLGVDTGYFVGLVGYAAYGFGGRIGIITVSMAMLSAFYMLGSLLGGMVIDRIGPRRSAILSSYTMLVVCIAAQFIGVHLIAFLVLIALYALVAAVLQSSFTSFAPFLSRTRDGIKRINSYMTTCMYAATIVGGLLGALVTATFAHLHLFLMVASAVAISSLLVFSVREKHSPSDSEEEDDPTSLLDSEIEGDSADLAFEKKTGFLHNALKGWHLIRKTAKLRFYLLVAIAMWFCFGAFDALESLYYKDILLVPVSWMGWVNAIAGTGFAIGAFMLSRISDRHMSVFLLLVLLAVEGATTALYVATTSIFWSAIGLFLLAISYGIADPLLRTLIQADSPLRIVGRVMGTIDMIRKGFTFIPLTIAPLLYLLWGIQPVLIGASILTVLMAIALYPISRLLTNAQER